MLCSKCAAGLQHAHIHIPVTPGKLTLVKKVHSKLLPLSARKPRRGLSACRSSNKVIDRPLIEEPSTSDTDRDGSNGAVAAQQHTKARSREWEKTATLQASRHHLLRIEEGERPLADYMALPASQYSVLDAQKIERLDDDSFRCYVGGLKFFGLRVEPVLTVSVFVGIKGPTVKLLSTVLEGSKVVQAANHRFDATMTNVVTWSTPADGPQGSKQLESNATIQVALEVPKWMRAIPVSAIERTGSGVMQQVLNRMLPKFLAQLQADYQLWASGDSSRKAVGTGQL